MKIDLNKNYYVAKVEDLYNQITGLKIKQTEDLIDTKFEIRKIIKNV